MIKRLLFALSLISVNAFAQLTYAPSSGSASITGCTATSNQWLTAVSSSGVCTKAQPAYADVSGLGSMAQQAAGTVAITGGTILGTTVSKVTLTAPATGSTLTVADGKTLTSSNTLTLTGTDGSSVAFGAGGTAAYTGNKLSAFAATTSAEFAGVLSDETGSGLLVFATSPTLTTPILGVAAATSINKVAITAPATSATLTIANGKTATVSNTLTFAGTDASTLNVGTGGTLGTAAYTASTAYAPAASGLPVYDVTGGALAPAHTVAGGCTLVAATCTVNFTGAAVFSGIGTFVCTGNSGSGTALTVSVQNQSGTQIKLFGTGVDAVTFICTGI